MSNVFSPSSSKSTDCSAVSPPETDATYRSRRSFVLKKVRNWKKDIRALRRQFDRSCASHLTLTLLGTGLYGGNSLSFQQEVLSNFIWCTADKKLSLVRFCFCFGNSTSILQHVFVHLLVLQEFFFSMELSVYVLVANFITHPGQECNIANT